MNIVRQDHSVERRRSTLRSVAAVLCAVLAAQVFAAVQARDVDGRLVQLAQPALRVVSLAPHLTELLFAAGAGDRVVGTVAYSDHPEAARNVPRVGDSALLDLERIVALQPDLLVVWRHGNSAQQLQRLSALKVPVFASEARSLDDIGQSLRSLGVLAGTEAVANARAAAFDAEVAALRARYAGRRPLKVFYQIWHQPLMTVNGEHLISQVLALCGAHNVFASQRLLTPTVAAEAVLLADPDAIVTGSIDPSGADNLDAWRALRTLRAARDGHLLVVNPDTLHRQSDRIVEGARELCEKLDRARATPSR